MAYSNVLIFHRHDYRLVYTEMYGFGLQSRPHSNVPDSWTDVILMPKGEVEQVMKRILLIDTE